MKGCEGFEGYELEGFVELYMYREYSYQCIYRAYLGVFRGFLEEKKEGFLYHIILHNYSQVFTE